jgi:hypothetical protein
MQEFNIDIGQMNLFTLKNFSFEIQNNGSADIQVDNINVSSNNISLLFTKTPFYILQNTSFTASGYLKIIHYGDSTRYDYIDLNVSWKDEVNVTHTDIQRYWLNYKGSLVSKYTEIISTDKIMYINNMLLLNMEFNEDFDDQDFPNIVLKSIDNENLYILPKIHRVSDRCISYIYRDNTLLNRIVNTNMIFNIIYKNKSLDIGKISYRSI